MAMFGFDERSVIFDVTPVANQFILEYLPTASGEFVKVYLYGLMQCYYPHDDMSVAQIAHDLGQSEEDVLRAYRHWERKGLVRRESDNPPTFRYINVTQRNLMGGNQAPADPAFESFAESVYALFGNNRRVHGSEMALCYEWVEDLELPPEVVILLLQHMIAMRGKGFSFQSAQKTAVQLAKENARTIEDAEQVLNRDKQVWEGSRAVLRRMGKRRVPSEDEMALYTKWTGEWGFAPDAVEAACVRTTRGDPSFAYLDGILRGMLEKNGAAASGIEMEQSIERDRRRIEPVKKLLSTLGVRDLNVNDSVLTLYDGMRAVYDDDGIILTAARECAPRGGRLDDVQALLEAWQKRDLRTAVEIEAHIKRVKGQDALLRKLFEEWGIRFRSSKADRSLLENWLGELAFSEDMIVFCARFATGTEKPMVYLDKILKNLAERGVRTPEEAASEHAARHQERSAKPAAQGRIISERQYEQRSYEASTGLPDWMREMKEQLEAESREQKADS